MQIRAPIPNFKTLKGLGDSVVAQKAQQTAINAGVKYGLQFATQMAAQAGLSTVASAIPYVGWAYAAYQLFSSIFGGGKGHHQGTGSSQVQPDLSVNTTANQQFEGTANLGAIAELSHQAAQLVALVMRATNAPYQSVIIGVGNANDQFNIAINVGASRIFEIANQHSDTLTDWTMRAVALALQALALPQYARDIIGAIPYDPRNEVETYVTWVKNPNYKFKSEIGNFGMPSQPPVPELTRPSPSGGYPITDTVTPWVRSDILAKVSRLTSPFGVPVATTAGWSTLSWQQAGKTPSIVYPPAPTTAITFAMTGDTNYRPYYGNIQGNRLENFSSNDIKNKIVAIITQAQSIAASQAQAILKAQPSSEPLPVVVPPPPVAPSMAPPRLTPQPLPILPPQLPRVVTVDTGLPNISVSAATLTKQKDEGKLWKIFLTAVSLTPFLF